MEEKKSKSIIWIFVLLAVVLIIGLIKFVSGNKAPNSGNISATSKNKVLVDCTATLDTKPEKVTGWNTYLYPAKVEENTPHPDKKTEKQDSYSMSKLNDKTETGNLYYRIELDPMDDLPRDTMRIIELCDENNKTVATGTTKDTKTTGASENVQASVTMMQTYYMQNSPKTYRVDAFIFTKGKWTLTDRIEGVRITE